MRKTANFSGVSLLLIAALLLGLISPINVKPALAHPGKLMWSIVDTPSPENNIIVSPSEVNIIAIGSDDSTFYAVDIPGDLPWGTYPDGKVYKSTDGGVTWTVDLVGNLTAAGANLPVWNLAIAQDNVNFLVAVTDGDGTPNGPKRVFVSQNGGGTWENTNITIGGAEYISCVDISMTYGANNRDIAVGTRTGGGGGKVYVRKTPGFAAWADQTVLPSTGWLGGDVVAIKFSPTYSADDTLAVVYSAAAGTFLNAGQRDVNSNFTNWSAIYVAPIELTTAGPGSSPDNTEIITADLELPSDFSGSDPSLRRFYVSTDATAAGVQIGVYRVDGTVVYYIKPPTTVPTSGRISTIAYLGNYAEGVLLAGEVEAAPTTGMVYTWRASDPTVNTPTWHKSDDYKSPTGGGNSGFANAQVAWSSEGTRAYCGTSSASPTAGGTGAIGDPTRWPGAWTVTVTLDESAFSVSPYSPAYGQLLSSFGKTQDADIGNVWNQLSLIDTGAATRFLSDVAVLEAPETPGETPGDYSILYLASINLEPGGFDSIWRSTSDPLGRTWERILCIATSDNGTILRVKQTPYDEAGRSEVIVFADLVTDKVGYSKDEGQVWEVRSLTTVTDLAVASDEVIYILNATFVYRYIRQDFGWIQTNKEDTQIGFGRTIAVPLKNPEKDEGTEDWVIVGGQGPPNGTGSVAWADFSQVPVNFKPPLGRWIEVPVLGDVQAIADDRFEQNKTIYAASHNPTDTSGKIYRWVIGKSTEWDELEPPNTAFYGLAMRNYVLYGAWRTAEVPEIIAYSAGVDRTLFPRDRVPPPPEWDYLTEGLPAPPPNVLFTREPSSLKISSNEYNNLWAIDNNPYDWTNKAGCLWAYTDTVAKVGPWTTSPASGDYIPVDPVSGRALEINFGWRQLSYASAYEMQLAKDSDFSIRVLVSENITPVDQLSPACYFPAGGLVPAPASASAIASWGNLEAGHTYYWRVRARAATTGEIIRSPWSATMYFTVEAGLPVTAKYPPVTLFNPPYGARVISRSPGFSWSPIPKATKYEFVLAKDAALQQVIVKTNVPMTSYKYDGELDFNTSYFWQVRAIEPVVSDPSSIGSFTVAAMEKPAAKEKPSPLPFWVFGVIVVCVILVIAMVVLAMSKPR
ncbi:MAG: hypothetical protein WCA51_02345 [Dehalococcoidia bacterium]